MNIADMASGTTSRGGDESRAGASMRLDAEYVIYRLEEAGMTLLTLPGSGYSTGLRTSQLDIVRTAAEAYGWDQGRARPGGRRRSSRRA